MHTFIATIVRIVDTKHFTKRIIAHDTNHAYRLAQTEVNKMQEDYYVMGVQAYTW